MTGRLVVSGLTVSAGGTVLVTDADFTVAPHAPVTLLGESGSGKSLAMHAIMGSLPPGLAASGSVRLDEAELLALPPAERRALWGRAISLLPQEPWLALDPTMRVADQVAGGHALVRHEQREAAGARADGDLAAVGLSTAGPLYPFQMSGGMCQRAAIAILHGAPDGLILADEPTKGLDAGLRADAAARLREEVARGRLLLTITHDIALARAIGGTVAVMQDGRIVEQGEAATVLDSPRHPFTRALVAADPAHWPQRRTSATAHAPVLEARGLTRTVGGRTLFAGLDLAVRPGEIVAVTGRSGSGKTMLGNVLLGLVRPDAGSVTRAPGAKPHQFQKIYQDPPASFVPHEPLARGFADLLARHRLAPAALDAMLDRVTIDRRLLARHPCEVSGGELQRLAIARALLLDPLFLFADEATSRLDLTRQAQVVDLLASLAAERGTALLFVTHDAVLAERVADRILDLEALPPASAGSRRS